MAKVKTSEFPTTYVLILLYFYNIVFASKPAVPFWGQTTWNLIVFPRNGTAVLKGSKTDTRVPRSVQIFIYLYDVLEVSYTSTRHVVTCRTNSCNTSSCQSPRGDVLVSGRA